MNLPFTSNATGATRPGLLISAKTTGGLASGSAPSARPLTLPPLPYGHDALEPHMSARTLSFHHGKHHLAYVENLNKLVAGTPLESFSLEELICLTANQAEKAAVFNNAAQVWNHNLFWQSMRADGGIPGGRLMDLIKAEFGTFTTFKNAFVAAGVGQFGSGWVWLVHDGHAVKIIRTSNADSPVAHGQHALLTCDVWEHAYYLDYQNRRKDYLATFIEHLANWEFAEHQLR